MTKRKIRIIKEIEDLFPQYQPEVGKIYDAEYYDPAGTYKKFPPICIINIAGKRIIIRKNEFEIVEG